MVSGKSRRGSTLIECAARERCVGERDQGEGKCYAERLFRERGGAGGEKLMVLYNLIHSFCMSFNR